MTRPALLVRHARLCFVACVLCVVSGVLSRAADTPAQNHFQAAVAAIAKGDSRAAVELLNQALAADQSLHDAVYLRGREQFKLGRVKESLADFDDYAKRRPERARELWERGIACYYAGRFADGRKQFEAYQTYHDADVENATWWLLCAAREDSLAKARPRILKVKEDRRPPMKEIYDLFAGTKRPAEVLAAAETGEASADDRRHRRFYAHLYVGLYHEIAGDAAQAKEHVQLAATKYKISHYMGNVAEVHAAILARQAGNK